MEENRDRGGGNLLDGGFPRPVAGIDCNQEEIQSLPLSWRGTLGKLLTCLSREEVPICWAFFQILIGIFATLFSEKNV